MNSSPILSTISNIISKRGVFITVLLSFLFGSSFTPLVLADHTEESVNLEHVVLQLKWKHQFQFAGFYAALKQGYYEEAGLDVEIREVNFERSAADLVLDGEAQYGISDSSLVLNRMKGQPVVVLAAIFQHSPLVLLSKSSSNILSPLELVDKRVMYQRNVDDAVLTAMFAELGINESNHKHVPHTFNDDALLNDEVDAMSAYVTNQPYYFKQKGVDVNVISPANYGIDFYGDMLFTEESYYKNNKDQVLKFRSASLQGWAYAIAHPEEMVDWIVENVESEKSREHLMFEAESTVRLIQPELVEVGYFSDNRFLRIAEIYKKTGLAPTSGTIDGLNYGNYFQPGVSSSWLIAVYAVLLLATFSAIGLYVYSNKLRQQIEIRSDALDKAKKEMVLHVDALDRYVLICNIDEDGRILHVSGALCKLAGYASDELMGQKIRQFVAHESREIFDAAVEQNLARKGEWSGEIRVVHRQEKDCWIHLRLESITDDAGAISGAVMVGSDITAHKLVEKLSRTDTLTQLYNRRGLNEIFNQLVAISKRYEKQLSFIIFDIDKFKSVNDTYGHAQGDYLITEIASITKSSIRNADVAGRWGGEEFVIVCPETDLQGAYMLAEKLRNRIASNTFKDLPMQSCSFGVAEWQADDTYGSLISRADKHMYTAKERGRNRTEGCALVAKPLFGVKNIS